MLSARVLAWLSRSQRASSRNFFYIKSKNRAFNIKQVLMPVFSWNKLYMFKIYSLFRLFFSIILLQVYILIKKKKTPTDLDLLSVSTTLLSTYSNRKFPIGILLEMFFSCRNLYLKGKYLTLQVRYNDIKEGCKLFTHGLLYGIFEFSDVCCLDGRKNVTLTLASLSAQCWR